MPFTSIEYLYVHSMINKFHFWPKKFKQLKTIFAGHNILHTDYHVEENWIYWVDFEDNKHNGIYRVHPDGSEKQHIIKVSF